MQCAAAAVAFTAVGVGAASMGVVGPEEAVVGIARVDLSSAYADRGDDQDKVPTRSA
jgi:hypothetical protein